MDKFLRSMAATATILALSGVPALAQDPPEVVQALKGHALPYR